MDLWLPVGRGWGGGIFREFGIDMYTLVYLTKRHMKRCSTSLIIREIQIKTTMRYHLIADWPSSKNLQTINAGEGVEKRERSCTLGGNVN